MLHYEIFHCVMHFIQWQQHFRLHKKSFFDLKSFLHIISAAYFRCNLSLPILLLSITAIYLLLKITFVTSMVAQKARHQQHFPHSFEIFQPLQTLLCPLIVTATPDCHLSASSINSTIRRPLKSDYKPMLFCCCRFREFR